MHNILCFGEQKIPQIVSKTVCHRKTVGSTAN